MRPAQNITPIPHPHQSTMTESPLQMMLSPPQCQGHLPSQASLKPMALPWEESLLPLIWLIAQQELPSPILRAEELKKANLYLDTQALPGFIGPMRADTWDTLYNRREEPFSSPTYAIGSIMASLTSWEQKELGNLCLHIRCIVTAARRKSTKSIGHVFWSCAMLCAVLSHVQ